MSENPLLEVEGAGDAKLTTYQAISALALNFAMKYHDINTVQDGTLYQQYKLEGRNFAPLHLDMVFDTAMQIEAHLLASENRLSKMVFHGVTQAIEHLLDEEEVGE